MTDYPIVCRSIDSGDISTDGNHIVLHAKSTDGAFNIFIPTEQIPRILVLMSELMQDANKLRRVESCPVLEPKAIEFIQRKDENREILRVQLGVRQESSLYFAVPIGQLEQISRGILTVLGRIAPGLKGSAH